MTEVEPNIFATAGIWMHINEGHIGVVVGRGGRNILLMVELSPALLEVYARNVLISVNLTSCYCT